jgi:hypothetical protein
MDDKVLDKMAIVTLAAIILVWCSGCAGSTGWRFEIGISPVKQLNNQAGLKQQTEEQQNDN